MFEQEIEKGIAFLDEKMPGWLDQIKPGQLNMRSANRDLTECACVLGQLGEATDEDYFALCDKWGIDEDAYLYGFAVEPLPAADCWSVEAQEMIEAKYRTLTAEWREKLRELKRPT